MPRKPAKQEPAWSNRFQTPTGDALAGAMEGMARDLYVNARSGLDQVDDTVCEIRWLGVPWRWSLVYRLKGDPSGVLAYLVPEPGRPQICVPLDYEDLEKVTPRRLSRVVRDGIVFAAEVGATRWAAWELQSESQIQEILGLVRSKQESRIATA
jgi:hypothetical protein